MPTTLLERIATKKESVKYRLNDIVDDFFKYLAEELTKLAAPPDRRCVIVQTSPREESPAKELVPPAPPTPPPLPPRAPKVIEVVDVKEEYEEEQDVPTVLLLRDTIIHRTPESPPSSTASFSMASLLHSSSHSTISAPVDLSVLYHPSTSAGISPGTHHEAHLNEDDEDDDAVSECDCEQCMGVPICKVDMEEDAEESGGGGGPSKKARLSGGSGGHSNDSIADYHDDDGEQCSATFKTLSIKCSEDDCLSMFKNKVERNQHLHLVHNILPYTCLMDGCNQGFDNVRQYGEHVNVEHKEVVNWPCNKCNKICTDHRLLCRHIYFHHQMGRFKCRKSKCTFVAPFRIDVRKHSQMHTELFACQFGCGKSFSHTHHRKRHERIHLRLKPFRCKWPNCGYCSEARSTVIRHIRIRHFNLPLTLKQQNELRIVDNRNPRDYMEILTELMN